MNKRYTTEMDAWLEERYPSEDSVYELCAEFEQKFNQKITKGQLGVWASSRGVRRSGRMKWTSEMNDFFRDFVPGHTENEIRETFKERFDIELTKSQIGNAKNRLDVKSGTIGGRFEKGHTPKNKGKTWDEIGIPLESRQKSLRTCFKKGNEPANAAKVPLGTERISKDGYVEVKVKRFSDRPCANKCWRPKHHLVWEKANSRDIPPGTIIVFADKDMRNFDPDNLVAIPRSIWAVISRNKIPYGDRETLVSAIKIAETRRGIYKAKRRSRICGACGNKFEPRYVHQKTCDQCLELGIRAPRKTKNGIDRKKK